MITEDYKLRCVEAIRANSFKYLTNKAHSINLGIDSAQMSRILKNEINGVISDEKFIFIGNKYKVAKDANPFVYKTAPTKVYNYIYKQLEGCQKLSISGIFCDKADIGKSAAAKEYVSMHRNAVYVDCGINKNRNEFLRALSKEFGIDYKIQVRFLQENLINHINTLQNPLIVLDEWGDSSYPVFLENKALWNGTENKCGWYAMGADALEQKFTRSIDLKRVGFSELFRRFGSKYQSIVPTEEKDRQSFLLDEIKRILKVNKSKFTPLQMYAKTGGSLTRVFIELKKEYLGIS